MWHLVALVAAFAIAAAGCGPAPSEAPKLGPVPDAEMSLTANNLSDRALELFVNDSKIADIAAKSSPTFKAQDLPPLPWTAELRLPTGRTLLTLPVTSGSVVILANGSTSPAIRADLSCGRIELFVIFPLLGPPPGPGRLGDCGP